MLVFLLTAFTLIAFAANSVLCRLALQDGSIDPVSFTTIRIVSGTMALLLLAGMNEQSKKGAKSKGSWYSAFALFSYAIAFSVAYVSLSAGTGALVLFGAVQITMLAAAFRRGERMQLMRWLGFAVAVIGLVYLMMPGLTAPDPIGAGLMLVSGVAWGFYSIAGKGVLAPIAMTSGNFLRAAPMALAASVIALAQIHIETSGAVLALASGVVTSGFGYVLWYRTLPLLTTTQASIVQLLVPALAAVGGVVFIAEEVTLRLLVASALILGGVALSVLRKPAGA